MASKCLQDGTFLITVIPATICVIISFVIIVKSIKELQKLTKLQQTIKYLYYITCTACICTMILAIPSSIFCVESYPKVYAYIGLFLFISDVIVGLSILAILLARLHYTFRDSMFKLSKCQQCSFIILYIMTVIICICGFVFTSGITIQPYMIAIFAVFYIGTCMYGMISFVYKMYQLTKLRATSFRNIGVENISKITVNESQTKLLDRTSRYVSLLVIAIISTIFAYTLYLGLNLRFNSIIGYTLSVLVAVIDCMVNILCLYLQYSFAKKYYDKYCLCCGTFWNFLFTSRAERSLQNKYKNQLQMLSQRSDEHEPLSQVLSQV